MAALAGRGDDDWQEHFPGIEAISALRHVARPPARPHAKKYL